MEKQRTISSGFLKGKELEIGIAAQNGRPLRCPMDGIEIECKNEEE